MATRPELVILCQGVWPPIGFAREVLESDQLTGDAGVLGYWRHWADTLAGLGYETLVLKQPPLGGHEACVAEAVEQVQPLVDEGRQLILVGHSRGGWIVRDLAHRYPDNVRVCTTVATPQTGQFLVDFHLEMEGRVGELKKKLGQRLEGSPVSGSKGRVKEAVRQVGRAVLPDPVRQALRKVLGRAREAQAAVTSEWGKLLAFLQQEGGDMNDVYRDYNSAAAEGQNRKLPNLDGIVYIDCQGELGKKGIIPPELANCAAVLEMVADDALVPVAMLKESTRTFTDLQQGLYELDVQAFRGKVVRDRRHDGATHSDCCVNPWGRRGPDWPSDNPSTSLFWPLDHCKQVGLFPSQAMVPKIEELVSHWEERLAQGDSE